MENPILTFDISKFNSELIEAIANDEVVIREGVAYWKAGLGIGKQGIIQHIPLKELENISNLSQQNFLQSMGELQASIQNSMQAMQSSLQTTMIAVEVISTASILVATAVQTQILSKKIEDVQNCVIQVSNEIHEQNFIFYSDKVCEYMAVLQSFKTLLNPNMDIKEVTSIANSSLTQAMKLKNHLVFFIGSLLKAINNNDIKDPKHISQILKFIQQIMEVLPMGMHLEFILSHRLEQYSFSQSLIEESNQQYRNLLTQYRGYLNHINNKIKYDGDKSFQIPKGFLEIKEPAKQLINSPMIHELLEKPAQQNISINRETPNS